ncbi:hypothetical protein FS837_001557 [Tulasnella sp. UAMH 9824]|nr:hypothetical protein FS837_001557 [Tulasnella sp. UAMH 9824]
MENQQQRTHASSTLSSVQGVGSTPILEDKPSRLDTFLASARDRASRRLHWLRSPLLLPSFQEEESSPKWGNEVRGSGEPKDFVVVILAQYFGWITTVNGKEINLQLTAVLNDPQVLLRCLGYRHGDTTRRWYFIMDFDVDYEDAEGVVKRLPRAKLPGTEEPILPTSQGIRRILRAAYSGGGSGFVHCGMHGMYSDTGESSITRDANGAIRYMEFPDGSPAKEAFIVGTDGVRLRGLDFMKCLSDGDDKRYNTTLTLMFDMCNAAEFLAGVVKLRYQYRSPNFDGGAAAVAASRSTNQLVVISASQRGQVAGQYRGCGALTYLVARAVTEELYEGQVPTASDIIRSIDEICQTQPNKSFLQTPQMASRYPLTGSFWLIPKRH